MDTLKPQRGTCFEVSKLFLYSSEYLVCFMRFKYRFCPCNVKHNTFLIFKVSRTPPDIKRKRQKEKDAKMEEIVILQLAPFSAHAVVMFEDIKLGDSAVRKLAIRNPKSTQTKVINHIYIHNFTKLFDQKKVYS